MISLVSLEHICEEVECKGCWDQLNLELLHPEVVATGTPSGSSRWFEDHQRHKRDYGGTRFWPFQWDFLETICNSWIEVCICMWSEDIQWTKCVHIQEHKRQLPVLNSVSENGESIMQIATRAFLDTCPKVMWRYSRIQFFLHDSLDFTPFYSIVKICSTWVCWFMWESRVWPKMVFHHNCVMYLDNVKLAFK